MSDIQGRLRTAALAAVDGEKASADELIRQVMRRHRRHRRHIVLACVAVLAAVAAAVPVAIAWHDALTTSGPQPPISHPTPRPHRLPTKMSGLPMPTAPRVRLLIATATRAAWYSTATRQSEPIPGLPPTINSHWPQPYGFGRLDGGWWAASPNTKATCNATGCPPGQQEFYFIADGSPTATRIGAGYPGDSPKPASHAGAVWLVTQPPATAENAGSARAQLITTAGRPLGPRYTLPAGYLVSRGVGSYLLLSTTQNRFSLWDPRTGRVVRRFDNVIAAGPEQIAWSQACRTCRVQVLNLSTGKTVTTPIPGGQPSMLTTAISDDGTLLAVQLPRGNISVVDTSSGVLTVIPGTALSNATWQNFGWLNGGHQLIVTAGPNTQPGPAQVASWQPGDARLRIVTIRNPAEISNLRTGNFG
jgi:hypothetical protein